MEFIDHPVALMLVAVFSFPVYKILAKIFFGGRSDDLGETMKHLATPDWYSMLKGRYWEDRDATMNFYVFIALCFGWVAAITEILARHVL